LFHADLSRRVISASPTLVGKMLNAPQDTTTPGKKGPCVPADPVSLEMPSPTAAQVNVPQTLNAVTTRTASTTTAETLVKVSVELVPSAQRGTMLPLAPALLERLVSLWPGATPSPPLLPLLRGTAVFTT